MEEKMIQKENIDTIDEELLNDNVDQKNNVNKFSLACPENLDKLDQIRALPVFDRVFRKMDSGSLRGVTLMWIRMTLGIGILTLPYYVKQYGAITGMIVIAIASVINLFVYRFIFEGSDVTGKKNYPDLIETLLGKNILRVFRVTYLLDITSTMIIYCIVSWNLLEYMIYFFGIGQEHWNEWFEDIKQIKFNEMNPTIFKIRGVFFYGIFFLTIPLFLRKRLDSLQKITIGYLTALFILVVIILIEVPSYREAYKNEDIKFKIYKPFNFNWLECFLGLCVSYYVQPFVFSLRQELLLPTYKRTKKIARRSIFIEAILFMTLGFFGYFALGDVYTPNLFILRKPYPDKSQISETIFRSAIGLFFITNTLGLAMYNPSLRDYLYPFISMKNEKLKYVLISLVPFFIICTVAFVYPYVVDVTNFFGITVYNFNGYIIPLLMRIQTLKIKKDTSYRLALAYILLATFICISIAGITFRVLGLVEL